MCGQLMNMQRGMNPEQTHQYQTDSPNDIEVKPRLR